MRRAANFRICLTLWAICSLALWMTGFRTAASVGAAETTDDLKPAEATSEPADIITVTAGESDESPVAEPATPAEPARKDGDKFSAVATHRQSAIIKIDAPGQSQAKVTCFCLTPDDQILAGCAGPSGEIRVFDREGKYLETWPAPFKPDAIFARADGAVFLAGEGQLAQLSSKGSVELKKPSPHAAALTEHPEKLREEVVAQAKRQAETFTQQTKQYDQMIERADKEIASVKEQIAELDKSTDDSSAQTAQRKQMLERRIAMFELQKQQYNQAKEQWANMPGVASGAKLTDAQIDERVKSSMVYKMKTSSISATKDEVFLATPTPVGYGFGIWRMDNKFENASQIVTGLSGCCGQMDVKANDSGVFVAENSQHRVCRFDRTGKKLGTWGTSARTGLDGFGSCCNPMNIAFGPGNAVYTAEDDTGRIKRYSVDGKLLGLVGLVELKPGCKNVSIAVSHDGSRVYMLDITRNHLVRMDPRPADDVAKEEASGGKSVKQTSSASGGFGQVLRAIFTSGE